MLSCCPHGVPRDGVPRDGVPRHDVPRDGGRRLHHLITLEVRKCSIVVMYLMLYDALNKLWKWTGVGPGPYVNMRTNMQTNSTSTPRGAHACQGHHLIIVFEHHRGGHRRPRACVSAWVQPVRVPM